MPPRRADGSDRPLRARGQRTRQRLRDAGVEVFARRGYHAARVDDIVKVARTSHGTFYLYFANKEQLFGALAEQVAEEMAALAGEFPELGPEAPHASALRAWLGRFAEVYTHYGPVIRAWTEAEINRSEFGRLGTDVMAGFTRAVVQRVGRVVPNDLDPTVAALALVAMIERSSYYVLSKQVDADSEAMLETLAAVVQAGLFPQASLDDRRARSPLTQGGASTAPTGGCSTAPIRP